MKTKTTKKTAKSHFESMSNKIISKKLIDNTSRSDLKKTYEKLSSAIFHSFQWMQSKEGFEFWKEIFDREKEKESIKNGFNKLKARKK